MPRPPLAAEAPLPPAVRARVKAILDREARRLLDEELAREAATRPATKAKVRP
jgi:hypothetical protein